MLNLTIKIPQFPGCGIYEIQDCMLELFTPSVTFFVWSSGGLVFPPMLGRKLGLSCDIGWLLWIVILTPHG